MAEAHPNPVRIAAKLYDARDAARSLLGNTYLATMKEYGEILEGFAKRNRVSVLDAARTIASDPEITGDTNLFVLASAVELIEPTPADQPPQATTPPATRSAQPRT